MQGRIGFANAGGGMIIYGIAENNHDPVGIDNGVDATVYNREWIENVLTTGVQPKIEQLEITAIDLPSSARPRCVCHPDRTGNRDGPTSERGRSQVLPPAQLQRRSRCTTTSEMPQRRLGGSLGWHGAWLSKLLACGLRPANVSRMSGSDYFPRTTFMIAVSGELRGAGEAVIFLEKSDRKALAELVREIDEYNSVIETVDPGQRENACLDGSPGSESSTRLNFGHEILPASSEKIIDEYSREISLVAMRRQRPEL